MKQLTKPTLLELEQICHLYVDRLDPILKEFRALVQSYDMELIIHTERNGEFVFNTYFSVPLRSVVDTTLKGTLSPMDQAKGGKRRVGKQRLPRDPATKPAAKLSP